MEFGMKNSIYFWCLTLLLNISIYSQADWKPVGSPIGGGINAIVEKDGYLFLGTGIYWSAGAIYRSDDSGKTWQLKINNLPVSYVVSDLDCNDTYIFTALTSGKVYRSSDYGETWEPASNGISSYLAYAVFADGNDVYAGTLNGVFKSTNNGDTWTNFSNGLASDISVHSFFKLEDYIFAGTSAGVYRSHNGSSWEAVNNGINQEYPYIYSIIYKDGYLFAGTYNNVYRSTNLGNSWVNISTSQDGSYEFKISGDKIYKSNYYGLHYTTDYGQTWVTFNNPAVYNKYLEDFYIRDGLILAGETELNRSEDNGNTWIFSSAGIANVTTGKFAEKNGILYTYSENKIYSSTDGINWQLTAELPQYTMLQSLFVYNHYIFAGNINFAFRSSDGVNWEQLNKAISDFVSNNGILFGIRGNSYLSLILRSTDSGTTWEEINIPVVIIVSSIVTYNGEIYIGGFEGLYKSGDNGETWQQVEYTSTPNSSVQSLYVHNNYLIVKDNSSTGLYRSINGNDWEYLSVNHIGSDPIFVSNGEILYSTASYYGVMVSYDNGENWTTFNDGLPAGINGSMPVVYGLFIKDNTLYASVANFSIWNTPLGAIPVELTSFTANYNNSSVNLFWQTASEINNKGFEIERRDNDGKWKMEDGKWEMIGFVNGKGTTTQNQLYSFVDKNLKAGKYSYRLKQIDFDGTYKYSDIVEVEVNLPNKFALEQNYPNPFNPSTKIKYHIPVESKVSLKIYNILGKEILTLVDEVKQPGVYEIEFQNNGKLSSGVYFYTLEAGNFSDTRKFVMLK